MPRGACGDVNDKVCVIMQKPLLVYIAVALSDIAITTYGISLGYQEGNPLLQWVGIQWVVPLILVAGLIAAVVATSWLYERTPGRLTPTLSVAVYSACAYRLVFGTLSWSWLITGYQPTWIVGGI